MKTLPFVTAAAALVLSLPACAHDTWFALLPDREPGAVALALGTGNQFPVYESGIDIRYLTRSGCRHTPGDKPIALQRVADAADSLRVRVRADAAQPLTCWAQSTPFEVELAEDKIALYFKDIQPSVAVREAWAQMRARGVTWKERYVKHARIELNPGGDAAAPVNMDMDMVLEAPAHTPRAGETLQFRVLRDGKPLPNLSVELRGDRSAFGIWRKTDAEGRVRITAPLPGRWILRGTDLRVAADNPDRWDSRFATLAFEIAAAPQPAPAASEARR